MEKVYNNIEQSLLWLGFEDIEFNKKFSAKDFVEEKENVLKTHISFNQKEDSIIPTRITNTLISLFEQIVDINISHNKILKMREMEQQGKVENDNE